ncbi:pyridoxamine 5'-phosphate oxidase [Amycolatopsis deserti]|uniref:Pyridoxamine 5'-phosphate oxidase n=1 Tax=Amycolatopsis deserti TaxID=185696 RepID=A0ABQ3IVL4_9PSEU|nr:pyridoxamine 5'-phosphate oxidase family protein [Amycolatopsis deserti]GHE92268.1 pyridoxamine 5'-phosphate oxidase [Amycolatopsis deserti]
MSRYAHLAYTESVRREQEQNGSASAAGRALDGSEAPDPLGPGEAAFIAARDGFYLASVSETGWPYVQYRGGPAGFVHVLDEYTLGFAEVRGNRQYITTGNVRAGGRVALFFMDYPRQARLKLFGHARVVPLDEDPGLTRKLTETRTDGRVERLMLIRVEGVNWNCHQHITPRYSEAELAEALAPVRARIAELEEQNKALRALLAER